MAYQLANETRSDVQLFPRPAPRNFRILRILRHVDEATHDISSITARHTRHGDRRSYSGSFRTRVTTRTTKAVTEHGSSTTKRGAITRAITIAIGTTGAVAWAAADGIGPSAHDAADARGVGIRRRHGGTSEIVVPRRIFRDARIRREEMGSSVNSVPEVQVVAPVSY